MGVRMPIGGLTEVRDKDPAAEAIDLGMERFFDGTHFDFPAGGCAALRERLAPPVAAHCAFRTIKRSFQYRRW
jgi:hypothetical protein